MSDAEVEQLKTQPEAQEKTTETANKEQSQIKSTGNIGNISHVGRDRANVGDGAQQNTNNTKN